MVQRRKRRGRPLLRASVGVATVSFLACTGAPQVDEPVGNLRAIDPPPPSSASAGDTKDGDVTAGDKKAGDDKAGDEKAGDEKAGDEEAGDGLPKPLEEPVGNLRPPPRDEQPLPDEPPAK